MSLDAQATEVWERSPFHSMLQSGASLLRRRIAPDITDEFSLLPEWHSAEVTDYVAVLTRFAREGVIGEMDVVYSSWGTKAATGFDDDQIAALERVVPYLALAIKSVSLMRMTRTLMRDLTAAGAEGIFDEQTSSVGSRRRLDDALDFLRDVDVLVVTKIDRLARSVADLCAIVARIEAKGASLRILAMNLDTASRTGRLMLNVIGSVAQFEREVVLERQREGCGRGRRRARPAGQGR